MKTNKHTMTEYQYRKYNIKSLCFDWVFCSYRTYLKYKKLGTDSARKRSLSSPANQWG